MKSLCLLGYEILECFWMGYENFKGNSDEFFGEKMTFPSTPVLSINNDQSLWHGIKSSHIVVISIIMSVVVFLY